MKKLFILLFLFPLFLNGQDLIIRSNEDSLNCKIINEDSSMVYFSLKKSGKLIETHLAKTEIATIVKGFYEKKGKGYYYDSRDGKTYKTIKIGNQIWMAENLAYKVDTGCWIYNNEVNNIPRYGYLYNRETAMDVCPTGWRLPLIHDFQLLIDTLYEEVEMFNMKQESVMLKLIFSTGFNLQFGGYINTSDEFLGGPVITKGYRTAHNTMFWTYSQKFAGYDIVFNTETYTPEIVYSKRIKACYVRCIKN